MKPAQYVRAERAIAAADTKGIRERWLYGLRLLRDPEVMSPGGGGLRHGVADRLIGAAKARGFRLSARELQYRIQCARAYATESQIRNAVADFGAWRDLIQAGFPAYDAPQDEPPADHRSKDERARDHARRMLNPDQLTLFPLDQFEPTQSTLKDLIDYATEQDAITERFAERGRERRAYLAELVAASGEDLSITWQHAHDLAFGEWGPVDE